METTRIELIQRQLVALVVNSAKLKHEIDRVGVNADEQLVRDINNLSHTAEDIGTTISELYCILPQQLLPTAETLRAIERQEAQNRRRIVHRTQRGSNAI